MVLQALLLVLFVLLSVRFAPSAVFGLLPLVLVVAWSLRMSLRNNLLVALPGAALSLVLPGGGWLSLLLIVTPSILLFICQRVPLGALVTTLVILPFFVVLGLLSGGTLLAAPLSQVIFDFCLLLIVGATLTGLIHATSERYTLGTRGSL